MDRRRKVSGSKAACAAFAKLEDRVKELEAEVGHLVYQASDADEFKKLRRLVSSHSLCVEHACMDSRVPMRLTCSQQLEQRAPAKIKQCYELKKALHMMNKHYESEPWEPIVAAMSDHVVRGVYHNRLTVNVEHGERRVHDSDSRRKHEENKKKLEGPPTIVVQRQDVVQGGRRGYTADLPEVSSPRTLASLLNGRLTLCVSLVPSHSCL